MHMLEYLRILSCKIYQIKSLRVSKSYAKIHLTVIRVYKGVRKRKNRVELVTASGDKFEQIYYLVGEKSVTAVIL